MTRNGALATASLLLIGLAGCGGGSSSPTETSGGALRVSRATVSVDGVVLNDTTVPRGHGGAATRFEADLRDASGRPAAGQRMQVDFTIPRGGMMGGALQGHMVLYDDGTHGDQTPGDGTYCYEDLAGDYGCHGDSAMMGEYRYDFFGMDRQGGQSDHRMVVVQVAGG